MPCLLLTHSSESVMKRSLIVLAAGAFLLVLFAKPLEYISHYTEHAGAAVHAMKTNTDANADDTPLLELVDATSEHSHGGIQAWVILLGVLALTTVVGLTTLKSKMESRSKKRGLT